MESKYLMLLNNTISAPPQMLNLTSNFFTSNYEETYSLLIKQIENDYNNVELHLKMVIILINLKAYKEAGSHIGFVYNNYLNQLTTFENNILTYSINRIVNKLSDDTLPQSTPEIIIDQYLMLPFDSIPEGIFEPLIYLMKHGMSNFPYDEMYHKFATTEYELHYDTQKESYYYNHNNKKLYYWSDDKSEINRIYRFIQMEQLPHSPHRYLTDSFMVNKGDVIVDIGAAEANFTLDSIELCEKAYIVEADSKWQSSLKNTFEPWNDKVTFIQKLISDKVDENTTTIDELLQDKKVDFMKLDVEGYEMNVLKGAKKVLENNKNIKLAVCTYHQTRDCIELSEYLKNLGFEIEFSEGYMLFTDTDTLEFPYFRKGLIRAWRK